MDEELKKEYLCKYLYELIKDYYTASTIAGSIFRRVYSGALR